MDDLTIIYYTDSQLDDAFAEAVRRHLAKSAKAAGGIPVVSVSQKPLKFGQSICVGPIGRSYRSILFQILTGIQATHTPFIALCEHDVIYPPEHFSLRPPADGVVFDQNRHRALIDAGLYSVNRGGRSMQLVIADREALIRDLAAKLTHCTFDEDFHEAFEPGKGEHRIGIARMTVAMEPAAGPGIVDCCNHGHNYAPRKRRSGMLVDRIEPWGTVAQLCEKFEIPREAV